jgi:hypothetical protein
MPAGNATIGALRVSLGLDSAQFEAGLKKAQGSWAGSASWRGSAWPPPPPPRPPPAWPSPPASSTPSTPSTNLSKTAQKVGVPIDALGKLKYAGELADVSLEQLSTGLRKLSVNMLTVAQTGKGPAAEAFKTLGVAVSDATGRLRPGQDVLADVAEGFAHMQDGATKTALAVQIFGKSGAELIPLLNEGRAGLKEMGDEAAQLGLIIDQQTGTAAEAFNDNLTRLKAAAGGVATQLAAGLAPALADISAGFVQAAKSGEGLRVVAQALGVSAKALASVLIYASASISLTGKAFADAGDVIGKVASGDFKGAVDAYRKHDAELSAAVKATGATIRTIWSGAGKQAAALAPKVSDQLAAPIVQGADKAGKGAKKLKAAVDDAAEAQRYLAGVQADIDRQLLGSDTVNILELQAKAREYLTKNMLNEAAAALRLADALKHLHDNDKAPPADLPGNVNFGLTGDDISKLGENVSSAGGASALQQAFGALKGASDGFAGKLEMAGNIIFQFSQGFSGGLGKTIDKIGAAFDHVAAAFAQGGPIFAAMAAIQEAGKAIGGKAGAAIAGFGSGGLVGAALGIFGFNKAKKKAKKEARRQAAEEAAQKAAEEAATRRELEIRLMEAAGDAAGAQAAREEDLLKALSPANAELQRHILELEHEADARAAAAALMAQQRGLEEELLTATGDAAGALKLFREDELAALPAALRPVKQAIYDAVDAANAHGGRPGRVGAEDRRRRRRRGRRARRPGRRRRGRRQAAGGAIDAFGRLADTLHDFGQELAHGPLAGLNPKAQRAAALAQFNALRGKTDEASLAALPEAGRALIEAARATAPNKRALDAVIAQVRATTAAGEAAARGQVSAAQQQLDQLHRQTDLLAGIQTAVLSVAEAMAA